MKPDDCSHRLPLSALVLFVVCGCSGITPETVADTSTDVTGGSETCEGPDSDPEDADEGRRDASEPDSAPGALGVGELCLSDAECASFLCFRFDAAVEEGFCTQYCANSDGCPPEGFECVFLANSGGDFARVCAPNNLCIDRDGDGYGVGPSCAGTDCDDLVPSIYLGADEVCDPA